MSKNTKSRNAKKGKASPRPSVKAKSARPSKPSRAMHRTPSKAMAKSQKPKATKAPVARNKPKAAQESRNAAQQKNAAQKKPAQTRRPNISVPQPDEVKSALGNLLNNTVAVEYLKKNVSKMAVDVVGMLVTPKTDEYLAEQLGIKINAIRRILNIMQGYGITNYYISKNTKGWLSFAWYINTSKLPPFLEYVESMEKEGSIISDKCNDYFICDSCYKSDMFVFTFDSAFENNFKCISCSKNLSRMDKAEAESLLNQKSPQASKAS